MRKILLSLAVVATVFAMSSSSLAAARDCDANAIMWCGAYSKAEFMQKFNDGDGHNSANNLQLLYAGFGIGKGGMNLAVDGVVTKDGKVIVNGKTVATGAKSAGRQFMPGSEKVKGVWMRSTDISFKSSQLDAWVYTKDGVFQWAVLKSCGNMVTATPSTKPTPQPKPITPQEVPEQPIPEQPAPELPEAGMELPFAAALGTTSVGYSIRHYLRSKRGLNNALRHK